MYIYKILQGVVPNGLGIQSFTNARRGRFISIPDFRALSNKKIEKLRDTRFSVRAARLFNCLPKHLRDASNLSVSRFKSLLDAWLATVPDQPQSAGYRNESGSNSLLLT